MTGNVLHPTVRWVKENEGTVQTTVAENGAVTFSIACQSDKKSPEILLDFGRKVTGYIVFVSNTHTYDFLDVKYGPVEDCLILPLRVPMPYWGVYEGEHFLAGRYFRISVSSDALQPQPVSAQNVQVYMLPAQYPVVNAGSFVSEDEDLNTVYRRGAYTLELCMHKNSEACWYRMLNRPEFIDTFCKQWKGPYGEYVIYDSPRRDREAWLGDLRAEALLAYTAFGAYDVVKNTLALFFDVQRKNGVIPGSGSTWMEFLEFNVFGIIATWECYLYSGDRDFLNYAYPYLRRFIGYVDSHVDGRGFLYGTGTWMWTLPREGYHPGLQILMTAALRGLAQIERIMDNVAEAERLEALREKILANVQKEFWDEEKGVFGDRIRIITPVMPVALEVNCYAITFGVATPEQRARILDYFKEHMWHETGSTTLDIKITEATLEPGLTDYPIRDKIMNAPDPAAEMVLRMRPHNKMVWPFANAYEVESRFMAGDVDNAFELIRRCWDTDRFAETDTYWEIVDPENPVFNFGPCVPDSKDDCYNSAAHGFSGWVAHILQAYVLGVKPVKPGFAETAVRPQTGHLNTVSGTVPTPHGRIAVRIEKTAEVYRLEIQAPAGVAVTAELSDKELGGRRKDIVITEK